MAGTAVTRNIISTLSGALSGAATQIMLHPLDTIKTRLQSKDRGVKIKIATSFLESNMNEAREIYFAEGVSGFFSGGSASVIANSISWGLYFGVYSSSKDFYAKLFEKIKKSRAPAATASVLVNETATKDTQLSTLLLTAAGIQTGLLTTVVTHPIWLVKTRMQLQPHKYHGMFDGIRKIAQEDGLGGLYTGFTSSLMLMSHGIINFVSYDKMKQGYRSALIKINKEKHERREFSNTESLILAGSAKVLACVATYPMQLIKTRIQDPKNKTDDKVRYKGFVDASFKILKTEGVFAFYRGMIPYLLRVAPQGMINFFIHEKVMKIFDKFVEKNRKIQNF